MDILEFIKSLYDDSDENITDVYKAQKESKDELLKAIASIMLTYTILNNTMSMSRKEKSETYNKLSKLIINSSREQAKNTEKFIRNTLTNTAEKTFDHYSYNAGLKDVQSIINENFKGKHFSDRVWDNETEVAKHLHKQVNDFLQGKVNVNQIKKDIEKTFNADAYNVKRLTETEISRVQNESFKRLCSETGVKKVKYNATLDSKTCNDCAEFDGNIYEFGKEPGLPRHPMCRCFYEIADDNIKNNVSNNGNSDIIKERVIRDPKFKINNTYLNTNEYARKFEGLGGDKLKHSTLKYTKEIIKENDKLSSETMAIIDSKGKLISKQKVGSFGGVVDMSSLSNLDNESVIVTHNHPMSTSFSEHDIALLMNHPQIKTIIAGGHDGTVYKLSVGDGIRTELNERINENKIIQEYRLLYSNLNNANDVLKALVTKYNWNYEVI